MIEFYRVKMKSILMKNNVQGDIQNVETKDINTA